MPSESLPDRTTESAVFCFVWFCWFAKSTISEAIRRNQAVPWLDLVLQPPDQATLVIQPESCLISPLPLFRKILTVSKQQPLNLIVSA